MNADQRDAGEYVQTYTLDNASIGELDRLRCVERTWDPNSISHLEHLEVSAGWKVLMIAAGAGGLVEWVADRVGPSGSVVATDLDPRHLAVLPDQHVNLEVRQSNVVTDELPGGGFDLVHTRLLLAYLPEREAVIGKLARSLKPGGWLIAEEFDSGSFGNAHPTDASEKVRLASARFHEIAGYDHLTGRRLAGWFRRAGLEEIDGEGVVFPLRGSRSETLTQVYLSALRQQSPRMIEAGLISEEDLEAAERRYDDPEYDHLSHTMMSVWGRRPR